MIRTSTLMIALLSPAAEPAEALPDTNATDSRLLESLLGDELPAPAEDSDSDDSTKSAPAGSLDGATGTDGTAVDPQAAARVADRLREAQRLLSEQRTGEPTRVAQRAVIDELNRLLEAANNAGSDSQDGSPGSTGSGTPGSTQEGSASPEPASSGDEPTPVAAEGDDPGTPSRNRDDKAEESSDRAREAGVRDVVREFRSDLAEGAWGHLPPRLREQLLNAGSDHYLPAYDDLVRRYFESLARPESGEPRR